MTAMLLALLTLPAAEPGAIGSRVENLRFTDIRYTHRSLDDFGKPKAIVVVATAVGCPLVPKTLATLDKLERDYRSKGVQFVALNVGADDTVVEMAGQMVDFGVAFPVVKDFSGKAVTSLGLGRTPEVVLLDGDRVLRYRGRVDDQYRPGFSAPAPTRHDLREALDEVLAGKKVSVATTTAEGCKITRPEPVLPATITYSEHIGPLVARHCVECHRAGAEAPFALGTFDEVRKRGEAVAEVAREGRMPPWFASPSHGTFTNRRGLTTRERDLVAGWVDSGMRPGDLEKAPKPPTPRTAKWQIGEPDLVLKTETFDLPATGEIPYQYAVLSHVFTEETWVQGVEILPEQRGLVHHANLGHFSIAEGVKASNFITGVVPGGEPMNLEPGIAYRIPKGAMLGLQIHFVSTGKAETTRVALGLRYARGTIDRQLRHMRLADTRFAIPPGDPAHALKSSGVLDRDAVGVGLFTHMHLRGKAMVFKAHRPDEPAETLLSIPNFRFDWQLAYHLEPNKVRLPKGTRLEITGLFDNSPFNPFNPDPKATVRDGPQTRHEMLNGFVFYLDANEKLGMEIDEKTGRAKK